jgi:hypothetical protein
MDALKRSLVAEDGGAEANPKRAAASRKPAARGRKTAAPSNQRNLLLPVEGGRSKGRAAEPARTAEPAPAAKRRKRA